MLKFIRKYQLIILAIGGSLLMVVFLFEPIIGRLSPDGRKATVSKLADGTTFNGFDYQRANFDIAVLKRVYPRIFLPVTQGGLGINQGGEESSELHWLLLTKQATDAGLIGDAQEGRDWIPLIAQREAQSVVMQQAQQGVFTSMEQLQEAQLLMVEQVESALTRNVSLATGMMRGITVDDVYRTLATARGIDRLYRVFTSIPSFSDIGSTHAAKQRYDAVAVDAVVIPASTIADSIPMPSDDELQTFFEEFKAESPVDNEFGIGYTQQLRSKIGFLTLDNTAIRASIELDRVELRKIWTQDSKLPEGQRKYPGDVSGERPNIEAAFREQRAFDIMFEADKILRSQVIKSTRGLEKEGNFYILPEDWSTKRPTLEAMAQAVVDGLKEQMSVTISLPSVQILTDRWLSSSDISQIPGFGSAQYRIGSRALPASLVPAATEDEEAAELITVQSMIPIVDPSAEDAVGNRYYAIIYDINPAGPADSIADVGRETVLRDYRTVKAFELLTQQADAIASAATAAGDLAPGISLAMTMGTSESIRPGVSRNLLVREEDVLRGRLASFVDPSLNTEEFRTSVLESSADLDPLASPEQLAANPVVVAVPIKSSLSLAVARVIAPRPMTAQDLDENITQIITAEAGTEIRESIDAIGSVPFSLEAMSERYGFVQVKKRVGEQAEEPATETETEESDA